MAQFYMAIVDGTGAWFDSTYESDMANSFCRQLGNQFGHRAHYERGPSMDGMRMYARADRMVMFLKEMRRSYPDAKLMLAGYSRGGACAVMAANRLNAQGIDVDAMFLFDPVARSWHPGDEVIPANVKKVWVARRDVNPILLEKYDNVFAKVTKPVAKPTALALLGAVSPAAAAVVKASNYVATDWVHPMRPGFGTTATRYLGSPKDFSERSFPGSHGALGGVGWAKVTEDFGCQGQVAAWMNAGMKSVGADASLTSFVPTAT